MKRFLLLALPVLLVLAVWLRPRPAAVSPTASPVVHASDRPPEPDSVAPGSSSGACWFPMDAARAAAGEHPPKQEDACLATLRYLLTTQNEDGSWGKETDLLEGIPLDPVGATSLALLSFLGAGYTHLSRGQVADRVIGQAVKKALQWLLTHQEYDGSFRTAGDPRLTQALATLTLAETYGMTGSALFKGPSEAAMAALVKAQQPDGAWGDPVRSSWSTMAMASALLSDVSFPQDSLDRARGAAESELDRWKSPKTLVSHLLLNRSSKEKTRPSVETAAQWLSALPPDWSQQDFSYWYFGSLALYQLDGPDGPTWKSWSPRLKDTLLQSQEKTGSWRASTSTGTVIRTSLGTLTLEVFFRYANVFGSK